MNSSAPETSAIQPATFGPDWQQAANAGLSEAAQLDLQKALEWSFPRYAREPAVPDGEGWAEHAAGVVAILAGLQVDGHTRMAALLAIAVGDRDVSTNPHKDPVTLQFGPEIGKLVHGYLAP